MSRKSTQQEKQEKALAEASSRIEEARKQGAKYLNLSGLGLDELPESIGRVINLETLMASDNNLKTLPSSISNLKQLTHLNIDGNEFKTLPEPVTRLKQLKRLDCAANKLMTKLPESIGEMAGLEWLYLDHNNLAELPESLRKLNGLSRLYLHGNDALGLPAEVLGPTWVEVAGGDHPANPVTILDYYFRARGGERPLNEAKLILVGRGGVGKTSIVNRLVHETFKEEKKTEGINITEWGIRLKGKEDVRLNVWDFGGQEIMHSTHQFFLTRRSVYLLVLNGREGGEEADAEYWLKLIESFGEESPVIVVLNKIKEHPFDLNRRALEQKYPAIRDFIKTDCEDGTGVDELHAAVERETDRLEHLRDAFPASWFGIKDKLAGMKKNYVSFEEYREFCAEHGEEDPDAQDALAGHLHNLGIVLNYREDPRLQDKHVLNPHWVTNGIYKILNSAKLEQQKGEIRLHELAEVLDPEEYPSEMHGFLLDLMKKFDLCFSFADDEKHYLIPELLDRQEPPETAEFKPEECLNFQYHYPVLPEGLLPRFIVRTHVLSEHTTRWRTGALLEFEGSRALVKADVQDKKVFINVTGPASSRRRLLGVIRSDFERIHRDIRNLQPLEMVPVPGHPNLVVSYQKLLVMEQRGVERFDEVLGDNIIDLNVHSLLNGVDLEGARRRERKMDELRRVVRLVCSYSHKDEYLRNQLETHLKLLQRQGLVDVWHDRKIGAGDEWGRKIDENLERADIIVLLVSADFIASDYCYEKELRLALERHEKKEARVIPVIVRDVNWKKAPFAGLQALPKDGKAVTKWRNRDSAWRDVSEGIERVVGELRDERH